MRKSNKKIKVKVYLESLKRGIEMRYCNMCGKENTDEAKYCSSCGAVQAQTQGSATMQTQSESLAATEMTATPDTDVDKHENKTMSILAYIIFFIPLIVGAHKKSEFIRFHTNQGTVLFIASVVVNITCGILGMILFFLPGGFIFASLFGFAWLVFPVFAVIGIVNAANDAMKPLPLIGKFAVVK